MNSRTYILKYLTKETMHSDTMLLSRSTEKVMYDVQNHQLSLKGLLLVPFLTVLSSAGIY